jgi:hypothetical protein
VNTTLLDPPQVIGGTIAEAGWGEVKPKGYTTSEEI